MKKKSNSLAENTFTYLRGERGVKFYESKGSLFLGPTILKTYKEYVNKPFLFGEKILYSLTQKICVDVTLFNNIVNYAMSCKPARTTGKFEKYANNSSYLHTNNSVFTTNSHFESNRRKH